LAKHRIEPILDRIEIIIATLNSKFEIGVANVAKEKNEPKYRKIAAKNKVARFFIVVMGLGIFV